MLRADAELCDHAVDLCQRLLRIDTTNPPGNERPAADLLATELAAAGLEPRILESAPGRANVVARHAGTGAKPPLLLTSHLDVVEADPSQWRYPPFSGAIAEGCLWGRGAIDMKNHAAMSVALLTRLAREGIRLERDVIFAGVADEEAGCEFGSGWLCDHHPELVRAEYAMGEGGGFNMQLGGKRFFTVQVAEKGFCWVRARVRGEPGHGSMPRPDSAVYKLAAGIARLAAGLPAHRTRVVTEFVRGIASAQPAALRPLLGALTSNAVLPRLTKLLPDASVGRALGAMLANTASPTVIRAGAKTNVIPGVAEMEIDGRTLPGQTDAAFLEELATVLGPEFELEVMRSAPPVETEPVASPLYERILEVLAEREPDAVPVPYMIPGFTDAKSFTRLGARWYGFSPVRLPAGMRFADMFHGHDERIPLDGLRWGTEVLTDVVCRFGASPS
ncbi:MAG: M20/M25/M40 family metallo-hydrolase [Deltaproteobacteria bacterium]|nr:M20/M25/M40 family metallo-hydrolase [Deltaproteobacteria bacterium]